MLLPCPLYQALQPHFESHYCWHVSRLGGQEALRKKFSGECGAALRSRNDPGSGCDFLLHHRRMIRHFKWVLIDIKSHYPYQPWPEGRLPAWVEQLLVDAEFDLGSTYDAIPRLVRDGDADALGGFIEANFDHSHEPGAGVHSHVHRAIDAWERTLNPHDHSAAMGDMATAPGNAFFWMLHGWLDEIYAAWQRAHGEVVDQTPKKMTDPMVMCGPPNPKRNIEILGM